MKNKKGFTLIELLAVIVVLAIIALITIPQVLGMTDKARGSANLRSVEGHIENVNNSLAFNAFENKTVNGIHSFTDFDFTNYPKKDHIRCETYVVVKNVVRDAINCNINNVDYCYSNGKGITCEEYNSDENKKLAKMILNDNPIVQTAPSLRKSSTETGENGLYSLTNANGTTYYFRGKVNNYVKFKNMLWQIVRINEDGTTRLVLNDSINSTGYVFTSTSSGIENAYYSNSTLKTEVDNWYNANIGNDSKIATGNYFCEAIKVKSSYNVGNADVPKYSNYTPDYLCPTDGNGHGYINANVGLITYDEAVRAGSYLNLSVSNTEFYLYKGVLIWTMSNMGIDDSNKVYEWRISENGALAGTSLGNRRHALPVINIKKDVTAIKQYDSALGADVYVID